MLYLFVEVRPFLCHPEGFPDASASGGIFLAGHLVKLDDGVVEFPACSELLKEMADRKHMDNPLLGFGLAFCAVDRYLYGPAQGMYGMFFQFAKGYMVSHYPETREWITKL